MAQTETEVMRCEGYLKHQWHPVPARTCALHLISYRRWADGYRWNETEDWWNEKGGDRTRRRAEERRGEHRLMAELLSSHLIWMRLISNHLNTQGLLHQLQLPPLVWTSDWNWKNLCLCKLIFTIRLDLLSQQLSLIVSVFEMFPSSSLITHDTWQFCKHFITPYVGSQTEWRKQSLICCLENTRNPLEHRVGGMSRQAPGFRVMGLRDNWARDRGADGWMYRHPSIPTEYEWVMYSMMLRGWGGGVGVGA